MKKTLVSLLAVLGALIGPAVHAETPAAKPDDSWISITGTVDQVNPNAFTLDYGKGLITVEMDDGDRDADAYKLLPGDKVTVSGIVDDDLFEAATIEASTVHVEKLGTTFYSSAADEEDLGRVVMSPVVVEVSFAALEGTVTSVSEEEFTLDTGASKITVEVDAMAYNPLDDEGFQQVEIGDRVAVTGDADYDLFEGREFEASSVTTLEK